jgi:hypothetical protein
VAVEPQRAPAYLPQGYKRSTRTVRVDADPTKVVSFQRHHWDGSLDARVMPKTVVLKGRAHDVGMTPKPE